MIISVYEHGDPCQWKILDASNIRHDGEEPQSARKNEDVVDVDQAHRTVDRLEKGSTRIRLSTPCSQPAGAKRADEMQRIQETA